MGAAGAVTDMLHAGAAPSDIARKLLDGLGATPGLSLVPRCAPCWKVRTMCACYLASLPVTLIIYTNLKISLLH